MKESRNLRHPLFIICCLLFLAHQIIQKGFDVHIPFIHSYLDDLLVMPIVLTLILVERRKIHGWGPDFVFSLPLTISLVLVLSIIFEWIFPVFSQKFTFDWWDFVAYGLGGVVFYKYLNA